MLGKIPVEVKLADLLPQSTKSKEASPKKKAPKKPRTPQASKAPLQSIGVRQGTPLPTLSDGRAFPFKVQGSRNTMYSSDLHPSVGMHCRTGLGDLGMHK
jgi:hypothetical protein